MTKRRLNPISDFSDRKHIILAYEEQFTDRLALQVLDKPKLSVWMVLIPIIFVYYFFQYQKFVTSRKTFREHYLFSIQGALDEAFESVSQKRDPDIAGLAAVSDVPHDVRGCQADLLSVRVEHYSNLLRAEGDTFKDLAREVYRSPTDFLLFINRLHQAEQKVNKALLPHLEKDIEGIADVIANIERHSDDLRRESITVLFD